jgi:hypothetical protein
MRPPQPVQTICLLNMRAVRIRPVAEDDATQLAGLPGIAHDKRSRAPLPSAATPLEHDGEVAFTLVAESLDGRRIVGCATYRRLVGPWAEADLIVATDYAANGLPRALVVSLARAAEQHGIRVLMLGHEHRRVVDGLRDEFLVHERSTGVELALRRPARRVELPTLDDASRSAAAPRQR